MKYLPVHIITIVSVLLTACNADPIDETPVKNEIKFNTGVVLTRGVIDSDVNHIPQQDMDDIQVIRGTDGGTQEGFNAATTIASSASVAKGTGTMVLAERQYFDTDRKNAHFMAFYPKHTDYVPGLVSWTIDGTKDIMVTKPVTAVYQGGREVTFAFEHQLAQVVLKLVAENKQVADLYGNLKSATINVPTQLQMTISNDGETTLTEITDPVNKADLNFGAMELKTDTTTSQGLMIYPDATGLTAITLEFENRKAKSYPISGATLQAGYKTVIAATVKGQAVLFDAISLVPWTDKEDEVGLGDPVPEDYK